MHFLIKFYNLSDKALYYLKLRREYAPWGINLSMRIFLFLFCYIWTPELDFKPIEKKTQVALLDFAGIDKKPENGSPGAAEDAQVLVPEFV